MTRKKFEAAPKPAIDVKVEATTKSVTVSEVITSPPESVIKTDEVKKKGWFVRLKEKREA
ncbi:hypothetical protein GCM10009069_23870 [Algimonas arctica]|uniref:Uncharacterized protein n=1 Tax=Algimonas arctica TaxID=1479486 RepID=A0A8J3CRW8_9PROT|nr:hypothetical protein GCM10009069_23870 [Algimonas arctica]